MRPDGNHLVEVRKVGVSDGQIELARTWCMREINVIFSVLQGRRVTGATQAALEFFRGLDMNLGSRNPDSIGIGDDAIDSCQTVTVTHQTCCEQYHGRQTVSLHHHSS
jgi:hypothetical protein